MSKYSNVFKSVSDERLVIDLVIPGFGKEDVTVKVCKLDGGKIFKLVVEGKRPARKNKDGVEVPEMASDHYISDFKYTFADLGDDVDEVDLMSVAGDRLYKGSTFFTVDYDLAAINWSVDKGVMRISIPKVASAIGVKVAGSDNADAASTGITGSAVAEAPAKKA